MKRREESITRVEKKGLMVNNSIVRSQDDIVCVYIYLKKKET